MSPSTKIIISIFIIVSLGHSIKSMSIGYSETKTINYASSTTKDPEIQMSNETIRKIFETAEQVTNATETDSVLMQLQPIITTKTAKMSRSTNDNNNNNLKNIMLLVVKKPESSNRSNIMEQFNAYYIHTAKASDVTDGIFTVIWNLLIDSTREFVVNRIRSMLQHGMQMFKPSSSASASASASGRTVGVPSLIFRQQSEINNNENNNNNDQEPKVVLLIPEPFHLPDVIQFDAIKNVDSSVEMEKSNSNIDNTEQQQPSSSNKEEAEEIEDNLVIKTISKNPLSPTSLAPLRYMVRPVGAFTGLSVNAADKTSTSVGTMITNTGLHFSLLGPSGTDSTKTKTTDSWRNYFRALGYGILIAKFLG
ncbi:hypothetical protein DERP_004680 [Dermatophagoides pteronyssinus]|nr:hypothetical protein DERP_004680 [Dermatophagoides pteronyssinus]